MKFRLIVFCLLMQFQFPVYSQLWSKPDFKLSASPNKLYVDTTENKLYILGRFTKLNDTVNCRGLMSWDGQNYQTFGTGFDDDQTLFTQNLFDVIKYKNKIYVGGFLQKAGNVYTKYIAQWDGNQWDSVSHRFNNGALCFKNIDDTLYIGGYQKKVGNMNVEGIVKFDGTNFYPLPSFYPYNVQYINGIEYYNGHLYVCGFITDSLGWPRGVMKLVDNHWIPAGQGIQGSTVFMYRLIVYQNKLIATGFYNANTVNVDDFIQAWNDTVWTSVGGGTGDFNGSISDMKIVDNKLYCVGTFNQAGGITANQFAMWDGLYWCSVGSTFNNKIDAIENFNDTIFIAGNFLAVDGDSSISKLAKWIGGNYTAECGNTTTVKELENEGGLNVYPNPCNNFLYIQLNQSFSKANSVLIINSLGQTVLELKNINTNNPINISDLADGLYVVKISNNQNNYFTKVLKN